MINRIFWAASFACAILLAISGCAHLQDSGVTPGTPAPSSSPTIAPGSCNTTVTATVVVAISTSFGLTTDPKYGQIAGYAPSQGSGTPTQAAIVTATTNDTVQFENLEPTGSTVFHSAVGFPSSTFPPIPYAFPSDASSPSPNTTISSAFWSTGRMPPPQDVGLCYSQAFKLTQPGVYAFGDLDFYNSITSLRDVIVVSSP